MMQSAKGRRTRAKAGLKKLAAAPIEGTPAPDYVQQLRRESHRGAVILIATMIEDTLATGLRSALLLADPGQEERLFGINGIVGTFSAKITMSTALKMITPELRELIDHVRLVRNAAAHMSADVDFGDPEMRAAALALMDDASQDAMTDAAPDEMRDAFVLCCILIQQLISRRWRGARMTTQIRRIVARASDGVQQQGAIPFSSLYQRDASPRPQ